MTEEEKIICNMYLDDMDSTHSCNEYKLLKELLNKQDTTKADTYDLSNINTYHIAEFPEQTMTKYIIQTLGIDTLVCIKNSKVCGIYKVS